MNFLKKIRKNRFFLLFFLWSQVHFHEKSCYHLSFKIKKKKSKKKVEKKEVFVFINFFFKIVFGHFFMSNFKIKKKVLKTLTFSIFSTIRKMQFIPQKSISHIFYTISAFLGEHFV